MGLVGSGWERWHDEQGGEEGSLEGEVVRVRECGVLLALFLGDDE